MTFKTYTEEDYEAVCDFLIKLNDKDKTHINWNWARFEWMYEHPEFDKSTMDTIGLWTENGEVVGAAIYDMYFGEGFCGVLPEYKTLFPEVVKYAYDKLKDDSGFALAICDDNTDEVKEVTSLGFTTKDQTENIMELDLSKDFTAKLPEGLSFMSPDPIEDNYDLQWLFWQGFDHGEDKAEFEKEDQTIPRARKHMKKELGVAARNEAGDLVSICILWHSDKTDYVYVEPVCTIPSYRGKGVAKAVIHEALNRAKKLGAKKAYVISDMDFYAKLGFVSRYHYTFYEK